MADAPLKHTRSSISAGIESYAGALALVAVSTLIGLWIAPRWGTAAVDMVYLPAVLAAAALWGIGPGLVAGIAAALAYNFFFTAPIHTFRMDRVTDVVTVAVLLIVALVTSRLAGGIRAQAQIAAAHARRNATIAGFAGRLLSCSDEPEIARAACAELRDLFRSNAVLLGGLPAPKVVALDPEGNRLNPSDVAAACFTLETGKSAGRGTAHVQPAEWQFHAVGPSESILGVVGLARDDGTLPVDDDALPLLGNLLDQVALAIERVRAEVDRLEMASQRERDKMRSTLLASIGKDLTPGLAALHAAAKAQRRASSSEKAFVATVESETSKLQRYVANMLDFDPEKEEQPVAAGAVSIDLFKRIVRRDGADVHLTPKEYAVLAELAKHPGQVLSHAHLLRTAWGPAQEAQTEYLRVAIRALRQKLEADPANPALILNEPAVGYRLTI